MKKNRKRKRTLSKRILSLIGYLFLIFIIIYNPLSTRLMALIVADFNGLDSGIFYRLVGAESSFNSFALSSKKAIGLGQVQEATARYIYPNYIKGMLWFPPTNLHISAIYYNHLLNKYRGNHSLALAAYNWGETNVDRKLRTEAITINENGNYRYLFRNVPETYFYIGKIIPEE